MASPNNVTETEATSAQSGQTASNQNEAVKNRYSAASQQVEPTLCCPVSYAPEFLSAIPEEILQKDYGCGDPSEWVRAGETVVDLGSGGGKLCYIAAQVVGPEGRVIGVDCNEDMVGLARKYQNEVANRIGYANTEFRFGRIQDLALDLELLAERIQNKPVSRAADWLEVQAVIDELRSGRPMIESDSVDCVVSNCVLNLVEPDARKQLFREIFRVLKVGGRAAISDIVSDEDVPLVMQQDGELWSGCISGAWREDRFVQEFVEAGFHDVSIAKLEITPWQVVNGIEFRSMTVVATKPESGPCLDQRQAVIYLGPFSEVIDDDGGRFPRGQRVAVCGKTFRNMQRSPAASHFLFLEPGTPVDAADAPEFPCGELHLRPAAQSRAGQVKTAGNALPIASSSCCGGSSCC